MENGINQIKYAILANPKWNEKLRALRPYRKFNAQCRNYIISLGREFKLKIYPADVEEITHQIFMHYLEKRGS